MKGSRTMQISRLTPKQTDFDLLFELNQITSKNKGILKCRVVDDTGIINATFNTHTDKLQAGKVYHMTHLKAQLHNGSLEIVMSKQTETTKQADTLGFKDKSNDISKKKFDQLENSSKGNSISTAPILDDAPKKQQVLIPFTKEQAQQQLKLKRHFEKQMRGRRATDFKPRHQQKNFSNYNKNKQNQQNTNTKYNDKSQQQYNDYDLKPKYKQKPQQYQQKQKQKQKTKKQYREKDESHQDRKKTKSVMYRQKV